MATGAATRAEDGRITLRIPADPSYVATARAFAASVARRLGCGNGDVEDLKLAVSEAASFAIEAGAGGVDLVMIAGGDRLRVEVSGVGGDRPGRPAPDAERDEDLRLALIEGLFDDASSEEAAQTRTVRFSLPLTGEDAAERDVTCPVCGEGMLIDITFTEGTAGEPGGPMQVPESRQVETFSCGHERVGPSLASSVSSDTPLDAERRTSEETTERPGNAPAP